MISNNQHAISPAQLYERISMIFDTVPQRTALSHGSATMSYGELDRQSAQFASFLLENELPSGATVAICLERSFEWIVAALGILRAGAAYVPLDPAWPEARVQYAVEDSHAVALIAPSTLLSRLESTAYGIDPWRDAAKIAAVSPVSPRLLKAESLAYIIYTSGSTGKPKGVEITHGNLAHLIEWHLDAFGLTSIDRISHLAGLGFDAAVWEIWPALAAGATLCIPDDTVRMSPELIQKWVVQQHVTIGFVPTVHAATLIKMIWPADTALRTLLTGGDILPHPPAFHLPFTVVNNYGPTECTVVATSGVVTADCVGMPTIGRAISGTLIYLLDDEGRPVHEGQIGEIYIGGHGVARGYRNLPETTHKSFLHDTFSDVSNARMYRSGDRGSRRADGQLEFHGRIDRQIKIRGQRIELDEISNRLSQYSSVLFALVTANVKGDKVELVGHVLPRDQAQLPNASDLQEYLIKYLPNYMVPSTFFRLSEVPLSPNGKIDVTLLRQEALELLPGRSLVESPINQIQSTLLTAMRELVKNPTLGSKDNFFLAGGHSLLGMQLIMRLRETYKVDTTLRELFDMPTVEQLSLVIERKLAQARLATVWKEVLKVDQLSATADFMVMGGNDQLIDELQMRIAAEFGRYLTRSQLLDNQTLASQATLIATAQADTLLPPGVFMVHSERQSSNIFWLHYPNPRLAEAMGAERPFLCLTLTEEDFNTLGDTPTLQEIARCFVPKILASQPRGPYIVGGFCLGGLVSYEVTCQLQRAGYEVSLLILLDVPSPEYYRPAELSTLIKRPVYVTKRFRQLGLRKSIGRLLDRASKTIHVKAERELVPEHNVRTQEIMEDAAFRYIPTRYEGKVALIMASQRQPDSPPNEHFLPWWRALVRNTLHEHEIHAVHLDLVNGPSVAKVAEVICSHMQPVEATLTPISTAVRL